MDWSKIPGPRIALLIPEIGIGGGAERVVVNLANAFVARGISVDLLVMFCTGNSGDSRIAAPLDPRVRLVVLEVHRLRGLLMPLVRYLRRSRPQALLACMWPIATVSILARMLARVQTRVVTAEHNTLSLSEQSRGKLGRWLFLKSLHTFYPRADAIVAVSDGVADDLAMIAKLKRSSITTIYNPIVGAFRDSKRREIESVAANWETARFRILNIGWFKEQKDQATLLRAFSILCKQVDAQVLILGDGQLRENLEALAESLGISRLVSFPGIVANPEYFYERATLFALSSKWEGFGNVIVEALEQGTPVVSTDCPSGPCEILAGGKYGVLVPVGDPAALAAAMLESLNQHHDRNALKRRAHDFSVDKAADAYVDLLLPGWRKEGRA